jgi:hypothetical protein
MRTAKKATSVTPAKRLSLMQETLDGALNWVETHQAHAPRLAIEAETLTLQLRRARVESHALARQLARPVTLALFGQSQAGKAWLLSEMVGDAQGQLIARLGDKTLNYFQNINPGNLDFAIATRFSHQRETQSNAWPLEMTLLSEVELIRLMLACAKNTEQPDTAHIDAALQRLQRHRQDDVQPGLESDALITLWAWSRRHHHHAEVLDRHFWPQAIALAPWLNVDDRVQLFALLWPGQGALNENLRSLMHLRHQLRHAPRLLAPLSLLVDDAALPAEKLISNDADWQEMIEVCPIVANRVGKAQQVPLGLLALLTLEITLPLSSTPRQALYDDADMLELPAPGTPADRAQQDELAQLRKRDPLRAALLEQKRALLPGLYAARQGIDLMLICTAASQRQDTDVAASALREWHMHQSIAASGEKPRLIWAITPHDARYQQQQINVDEAVQRQIGQPGQSWGSMLALDRAGVDRMGSWLLDEMQPEARRDRLAQQLSALQQKLVERLQPWTESSATSEQAARKQAIADTLLKCLQHRTGLHGELLERLQPSREAVRQLWLSQSSSHIQHSTKTAAVEQSYFGIGFEFDLFKDEPVAAAEPRSSGGQRDQQFPQQVFALWLEHLRQLPESRSLLALLNVDKPTMEMLVEELITASFRLKVLSKLQNALNEPDAQASAHEARTDRQVSRAMTVLGDFVAWLGFLQRPESERPESRVNRGQTIFARPPAPSVSFSPGQRLTRLSTAPANHTAYYIYDWLVGLNSVIVENNGYTGGGDLPATARQTLAILLLPLHA